MKKTAILATALAAALCIAPLAACGESSGSASVKVDGKPFNMADYAVELPETATVPNSNFGELPAFKSVQALEVQLTTIGSGSINGNSLECAKEAGTDENSGKYRLYNLKNSQSLTEWYSSISTVSDSPFLVLGSAESEPTTYQLAYPTGELVTTATFDSQYGYPTGRNSYTVDGHSQYYYYLTYSSGSSSETAYVAFVDGAWKKLTAQDVQPQGYQVGDNLGAVKSPLAAANGDEEDRPGYIYKDYSFTAEGDSSAMNYTLYKGGEKVDSVMVFNAESNVLGIVGKYFYYYESRPVSAEANSGYNYETSAGGSTEKYNKILHRYNFTEKKDEVVNSDYIFETSGEGGALYNTATNDYDRIAVTAYRKTGGVAIASSEAPAYTFILDEDAHISADMTGKSISPTIYKLSDTRYFSGDVILDKDGNAMATLPRNYYYTAVWEEQSLILCYDPSSDKFIAVDYDGKVAIAGSSSSAPVICGNSLLVGSGYSYNYADVTVFSKTSPNGKTLKEIMGSTDYTSFTDSPLIYTSVDADGTYTYTFYNLLGTKVGEFESNSSSIGSNTITYGGKCYFRATDKDNKSVTLLFA